MPPKLLGLLERLGCRASSELHARALDFLGGSFDSVRQLQRNSLALVDVSDLVEDDVRRWLLALPVDVSSLVQVIWPADHIAAEVPFSVLVERYDGLWYPSMDDVVVVWSDGGLLLMDHEERFFFGCMVTGTPLVDLMAERPPA